MTLSPMRRCAVRAALRVYPRWWRERYGEELLDLAYTRGITGREMVALYRSAAGERLRSEPLLGSSFAGGIRRAIVAVLTAYVAAVSVVVFASLAWVAVSAVAHLYLWTVFERVDSTFGAYLVSRWDFLWRMSLIAVPAYLGFCVVLTYPLVALLTLTRWGIRWPVPARVMAGMAFMVFPIWAVGPMVATAWIPAAWCFALVMFPSRWTDSTLTSYRGSFQS